MKNRITFNIDGAESEINCKSIQKIGKLALEISHQENQNHLTIIELNRTLAALKQGIDQLTLLANDLLQAEAVLNDYEHSKGAEITAQAISIKQLSDTITTVDDSLDNQVDDLLFTVENAQGACKNDLATAKRKYKSLESRITELVSREFAKGTDVEALVQNDVSTKTKFGFDLSWCASSNGREVIKADSHKRFFNSHDAAHTVLQHHAMKQTLELIKSAERHKERERQEKANRTTIELKNIVSKIKEAS